MVHPPSSAQADPPAGRLFVIVGLRAEARLARRLHVPVLTGGGTATGAEAAAHAAIARGATSLLSFGLAGGLDPALRPGEAIVPPAVIAGGVRFPADPRLTAWLGGETPQDLLAADRVAATADEKRCLWQATGAAALDLESGAVARIAARHGLAFAVLRAICDPAGRDLPPAALAALDRNGAIGLARVAASLLAHPSQLPALLRLAGDAAAARATLAQRLARIDASPPPHGSGTHDPGTHGHPRPPPG